MANKKYLLLVIALLPVLIFLVYHPGLAGEFVFDDFSNIVHQPGIAMQDLSWESLQKAAFSMDGRPISRASFGLNYLFTGLDPYYFKLVNLTIHSINAILILALVLLFLERIKFTGHRQVNDREMILVAAAAALAWSLHPVNLTSVLYSVQRMNSLSATFVLGGMLSYFQGRLFLERSPVKGWTLMIASIAVFLPLAWYSKENGALLVLFLFITEISFFRFSTGSTRQRRGLYLFFLLFLILPGLLVLFYIYQNPGLINNGYNNRYFSLGERLLTEPRVIWLYIRMILLPTPSIFSLYHDDIPLSTSLTTPPTTAFAITGLLGLLAGGVYALKKLPLVGFGILFFLAGHLMESSLIPLELAFEHRNYLPSIGLLLPLTFYLVTAQSTNLVRYTRPLVILVLLHLSWLTYQRAQTWSDNITLHLTEVHYHPDSVRANYEAGKVYGQWLERGVGDLDNNYRMAMFHFERVTALRDNTTSGLFGIILASNDSGNTVQPEWIKELENRLSIEPLEQVNLNWLDKMTDCVNKGACKEHELQIPRLLRAAISYPHASKKNKASLYAILAKYQYLIDDDADSAASSARLSVSLMPSNLYHRLNLVKYLVAARQYDRAREELDMLRNIDKDKLLAGEIKGLKILLMGNDTSK